MRHLLLIVFLLTASATLNAQSWQWGKRGGGGVDFTQYGSGTEQAEDMAVDKNGNVYVLFNSRFDQNDVDIDGHPLTGYGYQNVVLSSFRCDGTYRWSKVIGDNSLSIATALKTDTLDGVYVSCYVPNWYLTAHYDTDTVISASNAKTLSLIKYDTAGNYQWLRRPQPDTAGYGTVLQRVWGIDMDIDAAGNLYWMCYVPPGLYGNSYPVDTSGTHIFRYDRNGNFLGGSKMDITFNPNKSYLTEIHMRRSPRNGKFIITGSGGAYQPDPAYFGSTQLSKDMIVASFGNTGAFEWLKQNTNPGNGEVKTPVIDTSGNIYITGTTENGDSFNGVTFTNPVAGITFPILFKLDTTGNFIWYKSASTLAACPGRAVGLTTSGEVMVGGAWGLTFRWQGTNDSFVHPYNYDYDIFITRFNAATGAYIKTDTIGSGPAGSEDVSSMICDRKGNAYVGGSFSQQLKVTGVTMISAGGDNDMFIAKYGYANCSCTLPVANFTSTNIAANTVQFIYSGTSTGIDSLAWDFGDGQKEILTANYSAPLSHTYAGNGNYLPCATVYSSCGSNQYCGQVALAVGSINVLNGIQVYPNPANNYLMIEGAEGATATLMNSVGQRVVNVALSVQKQSLNTKGLASGVYILTIQDKNGNKEIMRINKQ